MQMNKGRHVKLRIAKSTIFKGVTILLIILSVIPLFAILGYIIKEGITKINWSFITNLPKPVGEAGGGIANALRGSLIMVALAAIIAIPVGVMTGIYLSENRTSKLAYWSGLAIEILQGVPSIVIGIVVYFWVVKPMGSFSAFSGSIALSIMMLPIIVRSTEETLKLLPSSLKEAALALGMSYHRMIMKVIVPCGFTGIISGIMLSVARIAGETAPLLFTAFGNPYLNTDITRPMQSLPLLIFNYATSPYDDWHNLAWGAAFILLVWVLLLNIITKVMTRRWKIQF
jgi:phosphate transport system permease protein